MPESLMIKVILFLIQRAGIKRWKPVSHSGSGFFHRFLSLEQKVQAH